MSVAGHGRGYYGDDNLDRSKKRGGGWVWTLAIVGVGATAAWLLWPRRYSDYAAASGPQQPVALQPPVQIAQGDPVLEQAARAHGYTTLSAYEDAVLAQARELQASGAKVDLAPHLHYLAPRLLMP